MEELRLLRRVRAKAAALLRAMDRDWLSEGSGRVKELRAAIRQSRGIRGDDFSRLVEDIDRVASRLPLDQALAFLDELGEVVANMRRDAPVNDSSANSPPDVGPATFGDALAKRWADLSPEEAQAAYDAAPEVPLSEERIDEIVAYATGKGDGKAGRTTNPTRYSRCVCGHTCDQHANIGGSGACRVRPCPCEAWHDTPKPTECECEGCWRESNMPPAGPVDVL